MDLGIWVILFIVTFNALMKGKNCVVNNNTKNETKFREYV